MVFALEKEWVDCVENYPSSYEKAVLNEWTIFYSCKKLYVIRIKTSFCLDAA